MTKNSAASNEKKPEVPPSRPPAAKPRQIKYEYHEVIVIKTGQTMGLHIKKNEQTGEIYVSNIGSFLKIACLVIKIMSV